MHINDDENESHSSYDEDNSYTSLLSARITEAPKSDAKSPHHSYPPEVSRRSPCHEDEAGIELNYNDFKRLEKKQTLLRMRAYTFVYILSRFFRFGTLSGVSVWHYRSLTETSNMPNEIRYPRWDTYTRRSVKHLAVTLLLATTAIFVIMLVVISGAVLLYGGIPPSYSNVRLSERSLPQHRWGHDILDRPGGFAKAGAVNTGGFIEGTSELEGARYLRFPDHLWGHGLNNVLQEALLYGLLAHYSNRSYVFEDFVWSHLPLPYTLYDFTLRPTRMPMSAFLGGWLVGQDSFQGRDLPRLQLQEVGRAKTGREDTEEHREDGPLIARVRDLSKWARAQFVFRVEPQRPRIQKQKPQYRTTTPYPLLNQHGSSPDPHFHLGAVNPRTASTSTSPRDKTMTVSLRASRSSISAEYFEHICPPSRRVEIVYDWPSDHVPENAGPPDPVADGIDILDWWLERLEHEDVRREPCVVIKEQKRRVWDSNFFGSIRPLSLLPLLRESPILTSFAWSDLVTTAIDKTVVTFFPSRQRSALLRSPQTVLSGISQMKPSTPLGSVGGPIVEVDRCPDCPPLISWDVGTASGDIIAHSDLKSADCLSGTDSNCQYSSGASDVVNTTDNISFQENIDWKVIPGMLAVHLRRGDYKRHCLRLAHWRAGYMAWNRLVETPSVLPDTVHDSSDSHEMSFESGLLEYLKQHNDSRIPDYTDTANGTSQSLTLLRDVVDIDMADQKRRTPLEAYYLAHCLPTISQIVKRLREVREEYERAITSVISTMTRTTTDIVSPASGQQTTVANTRTGSDSPMTTVAPSSKHTNPHEFRLKEVYVLTNGWPSFVEELRVALLEDGWEKVVGSPDVERGELTQQEARTTLTSDEKEECCIKSSASGDLPTTSADAMIALARAGNSCRCTGEHGLNKEEKGVSAAIDMGLAERAEIFVGNGFSSLSANIVMLRLARGLGVHTNRML
ncbi:Strobilurin A biosynthesis cluster protein l1 [Psilocybe cubensis]|uniref:Strobilurin A biosynthesis cluster protein l1 n=1 Tax=Psilocybe cubensis TaxID=181762 RepID=A0ACB8GM05_PSICU|nr:Strobilurin A biosynthesis cluster protein l1 [Psilocybe cubensis]KAH9476504.1 Strobilurin A biosynthesis cluster protein l1 [Psilocybe cubensis]